jgi:hypothetical protein
VTSPPSTVALTSTAARSANQTPERTRSEFADLEDAFANWQRRVKELERFERGADRSDAARARLAALRSEVSAEGNRLYRELMELRRRLEAERQALEARRTGLPEGSERDSLDARLAEIDRAVRFAVDALEAIQPMIATAAPALPSTRPVAPAGRPDGPPQDVPLPQVAPVENPPVPQQSPAVTAPQPEPAPSGAASIARYADQLRAGHAVFDPPETMVQGHTETVHLIVSAEATVQELEAELRRLVETDAERRYIADQVQISRVMRARLTGVDFDIDDTEYQERLTDATTTTRWTWQVRPTRAGRLMLTVTLVALIDDGGTLREVATPYERSVTVEAQPVTWRDIAARLTPPPQVVYGTIGAGLTAGVAWWRRRRRMVGGTGGANP